MAGARTLTDELATAMLALKRAMDTADHCVSERLGLNRTDARCLSLLITEGPMSPSELAAMSLVAPAAMTHVLDRLERAGHVRRVRSADDRRRVVVEVQAQTGERLSTLWGQVVEDVRRQLASYSRAQQELLLAFLRTQTEIQLRHAKRSSDTG